jgi:hypothetical protein
MFGEAAGGAIERLGSADLLRGRTEEVGVLRRGDEPGAVARGALDVAASTITRAILSATLRLSRRSDSIRSIWPAMLMAPPAT